METGLFIACAALTAACALIAVYFMKAFREKTYDRAAILKTAAGLCFLMIGVLFAAGMSGDKRFAWLVAAGLAFGVLGDLLLAIRFIRPAQHDRFFVSGALSFAVGGVMFPISDSILSAYSFGPDKHFGLNIGVHATYYLAQICIAWSLAFV